MFSTLQSLGLEVSAFLRNTARGVSAGDAVPEMSVELTLFQEGQPIFHDQSFATLSSNGICEISSGTCSAIAESEAEKLVVVRCSRPGGEGKYFSQEHQVTFKQKQSGKYCFLVYDQLPISPVAKKPSPIVVFAPKVWVGQELSTYLIFCNSRDTQIAGKSAPLEIKIMSEDGSILHSMNLEPSYNDVTVVNLKEELKGKITIESEARFFSAVARGGSSQFVVYTMIVNEKTGNMALEHSLPPIYYSTGDMRKIRQEALCFDSVDSMRTL